jgi:hypothetical protein
LHLVSHVLFYQRNNGNTIVKKYSFPKSIYSYVHFGIILITNSRGLYFWEFTSHLAESQIPPVGCVQKIEKHWIRMVLLYRTSFRPGTGGSIEINPLWNVQQIKWKPASTSCWMLFIYARREKGSPLKQYKRLVTLSRKVSLGVHIYCTAI